MYTPLLTYFPFFICCLNSFALNAGSFRRTPAVLAGASLKDAAGVRPTNLPPNANAVCFSSGKGEIVFHWPLTLAITLNPATIFFRDGSSAALFPKNIIVFPGCLACGAYGRA